MALQRRAADGPTLSGVGPFRIAGKVFSLWGCGTVAASVILDEYRTPATTTEDTMARTDHHAPEFRANVIGRTRTRGAKHSLGVSLAGRAAGFRFYRDEIVADGGKTSLRRRVRRTDRHAFRAEVAAFLR